MTNRLADLRNELIKASQAWAAGGKGELARARELRDEAVRLNHAHYLANIPVYGSWRKRKDTVKSRHRHHQEKLMFSADIFKSYEQNGWTTAISPG